MKTILLCILLCLFGLHSNGQNISPKNSLRTAATPIVNQPAYNISLINYSRQWEPKCPTADTAFVKSSSRTVQEVSQKTDYFDGLSRSIQSVAKGISPSGKDYVNCKFYDSYGRETIQYLVFSPKTGNTSDGKMKTDPFNQQAAFYKDTLLNPSAAGETIYYGRIDYESSPLKRVIKSYGVGNALAKEGGNKPVEKQYLINTGTDSVRLFKLADNAIIPVSTSFYNAGTLFKDLSIDEAGNQTIEFKDKEGNLVLKRTQLANAPQSAHMGYLNTYYVYNSRGLLAFILSPKATDLIKGTWSISSTIASELCFIYRYDQRNRMFVSKMPGADSVEMVYDKRDRMVIKRDGILKGRGMCMVNAYDSINRPYMKALFYGSYTRAQMQTAINTTSNPDPKVPVPFISESNLIYRDYTYYDNYNFPGRVNYVTTDINKPLAGSNPYPENIPSTASIMTKGLVTGNSTFVISTEEELPTTIYYNNKGRVIQKIARNFAGGTDVVNTKYNFSGKILSTYLRHSNPKSTETPSTTLQTMYHYDAAGRLDSVKKILNDNGALSKTIALHKYDETGQKLSTRLDANGSNQIETLNYSYNLRGQMTGINKLYLNTLNSTSNWFGQEISYEYGFDSAYVNGNIAGVRWKGRSDGLAKAFGFSYDRAGRLQSAYFTQQNQGATSWTQNVMNFSVSGLTYDANSNIRSMKQVGMNGPYIATIDSLKYEYITSSNRLLYVTDKYNNQATTLGDFNEIVNAETQDYNFDPNGNVCKDRNKGIDTIMFDHNNLPGYVSFGSKGSIWFIYDGQANKVGKVTIENGTNPKVTVTNYCGDFVYLQDTLQYISHEEGRIRPVYRTGQSPQYTFDYFLRDHLGNVRVVLGTQKDTSIYAATMETAASEVENALFSNIDNTRAPRTAGHPLDNTTNPNSFVAKLNGSGQKIGPSLVLRVMSGDSIQIAGKAYYMSPNATSSDNTPNSMVAAILQAFSDIGASEGTHVATGAGSPLNMFFNNSLFNALKNIDTNQNKVMQPKAYLNYVLFDDQFNMVNENSGVRQVQGNAGTLINLVANKYVIKKTGFLYIYTSNESNTDVFFDNLIVTHFSGPLLEETHYYPFGLTMAGISSRALKGRRYVENPHKFNGKEIQTGEFSDGTGLDQYDFGVRMYDHQIGRWGSQDKFTEVYNALTPYHYAGNNPVKNIDEAGKILKDKDGNIIATVDANARKKDLTYRAKLGSGADVRVTLELMEVTIYTDKGTPVQAYRAINVYYQLQYAEEEVGKQKYAYSLSQKDLANCHGYAFGDGKVWFIDETSDGSEFNKLLADEYNEVPMSEATQAVIEWRREGEFVRPHSGKRNADGTYDHKDENQPVISGVSYDDFMRGREIGGNGYYSNVGTKFYSRRENNNGKTTNATQGVVINGIRYTNKTEINKIFKQLGLKPLK